MSGPVPFGPTVALRGSNLYPKDSHFGGEYSPWHYLWAEWDFDGWIGPQILRALEQTGCNAIKLGGNLSVIATGAITLEQYLDRWSELLDYLTSCGLYAYIGGGNLSTMGGLTLVEQRAIYNAWGALVDTYDNVVAIDITGEWRFDADGASMSDPDAFDVITALAAELRLVTDKPLCNSDVVGEEQVAAGMTAIIESASISDWVDVHVYYHDGGYPIAADFAPLLGLGKPIIIGEFGADTSELTPAECAATYEAIRQLAIDLDAVGVINWATYGAFGLFDEHRWKRTYVADVFENIRTTR